ncbi:MAG: hypothetical protein K0R39_5102 [Symbiobacteriaceae bacterium]|jgi:hypothetical protein|nr:hypothetical protein [Symbiobacteriaceae bacterium]
MARIMNKPAEVATGPGGRPVAFKWSGGRYRVREVLDYWLEAGRWWERESEKATWRVATVEGGVFELTFEPGGRRWFLYKAYD